MKKILFILGAGTALFCTKQSQAQAPFTFSEDEISVTTGGTNPDGVEELIIPNKIRNMISTPFKFEWRYLNPEDKPETWTLSGFCDNNTCYTSGWQAGETKESFDVMPGDQSDFKLQMKLPIGIAENGTASFKFEAKVGDHADTAVFIVTKSTTGVQIIPVDDSRINIFPNPNLDNQITIYIAKELNAQKINIYNMMGRLIATQQVSLSDEFNVLDVNPLASELHIIQVIDNNNSIISSRKFQKQ